MSVLEDFIGFFFSVCTMMYVKGILTLSMQTSSHCDNAMNYVSGLLNLFSFLYTVCIYELSCNLNCINKLILKRSLPPDTLTKCSHFLSFTENTHTVECDKVVILSDVSTWINNY